MSRRGSRSRRQARRHALDRRERAVEEWASWRERTDREQEQRMLSHLRELGRKPGWRVRWLG
jgi:hypothetical protein